MVNHNENYSDLGEAIQLAGRLARKRVRRRVAEGASASSGYVSFSWDEDPVEPEMKLPAVVSAPVSQTHYPAPESPAPAYSSPEASPPPPAVTKQTEEARSFDNWDDFLAWSLKLTAAQAGFVVDAQGFVIAQLGQIPSEGLDGLGAELCFSVEQLKRVGVKSTKLQWVEMEYDKELVVAMIEETVESGDVIVSYYCPQSGRQLPKATLLKSLASSKELLM